MNSLMIISPRKKELRLAVAFLVLEGFEVDLVADAEQALRRLEVSRPRAILVEGRLPDVSGLGLVRMLKSWDRTRHLPVLVLDPPDAARARKAGCDGILMRPLDVERLPFLLDQHLRMMPEALRPSNTSPQQRQEPASARVRRWR